MSPTESVLKHYRQRGYVAEVVERFINAPGRPHRKDLFGFGDILIFHSAKKEVALVQACTRGDMVKRKNKILASTHAAQWLACGNKIYLCGLAKRKVRGSDRIRYELVEQEIII